MEHIYDIDFIRKNWIPSVGNKDAERSVWDDNAPNYRDRPLPTAGTDLSMRCVAEQEMLSPEAEVLDVGCGGGVYSIPLARQSKHLIGTDVAPQMLETARFNAERYGTPNTEFLLIDWHSFELPQNWSKRFDLVFANMTPAIQSYHTLDLMNRASRKWCYLSKPVEWKNSVIYDLVEELGLWAEYRTFDEDMLFAFNALRLEGYLPYTAYCRTQWHSTLPLEQAIRDYTARIDMKTCLNEKQRSFIRDYLISIAVNGMVSKDTDVLIAAMYWRTDL